MKTRNSPQANPSLKASAPDADEQPLSVTVLVIIADSRKSTCVIEAGRDKTFDAGPEALAALPGQLHLLMQGAETDALRGMNQLLAQLAQPELETPPSEVAVPVPAPGSLLRLVPSATGLMLVLAGGPDDAPVTDEYLLPLSLPLTDALPGALAGTPESAAGSQ